MDENKYIAIEYVDGKATPAIYLEDSDIWGYIAEARKRDAKIKIYKIDLKILDWTS